MVVVVVGAVLVVVEGVSVVVVVEAVGATDVVLGIVSAVDPVHPAMTSAVAKCASELRRSRLVALARLLLIVMGSLPPPSMNLSVAPDRF